MSIRVNLIPIQRRQERVNRAQKQGWATVVVIVGLSLLTVYGIAMARWRKDPEPIRQEIASVNSDIKRLATQFESRRSEFEDARTTLAAIHSIGSQPDWSLLLAYLGHTMGEDVFLRDFRLVMGERLSKAGSPEGSSGVVFLRGYGGSSNAVSQFVLSLEDTPLFDETRLLGTLREPYRSVEAFSFEIECAMAQMEGVGDE